MAITITTASTHILLLATILLAAASLQAQRLPPPPATAPSAASVGQCPPGVVAELGVCVDMLQLGRMSPENTDRCCQRIRELSRRAPNADAAVCLCAAFSIPDDGAEFSLGLYNDPRTNIVLDICGEAPVPGFACPGALTR